MEKVLSDLLMSGYEAHIDSKVRKAYIAAVEKTMNTQVLGTVQSPGQWKFPKVEKAKRGNGHFLVKKGLTGGNARKVLLGLDKLIACTFLSQFDELPSDPAQNVRADNALHQQEWMTLWKYAVPVITDLEREDDWTDEQIWAYLRQYPLKQMIS